MQRVKIAFDRNQDSVTQQYLIYRALGSNEPVLAYIVEHPAEVNLIRVTGDILQRTGDVYYTSHGNIIEDRSIEVKVDDQVIEPVMVDYHNGVIRFSFLPEPDSAVTASYWYDGVELVDTSMAAPGVTRVAPPAVDRNPPKPVQNPVISLDPETKLARISFEEPPLTEGTTYRYFVVAADTRGNRSWPSTEMSATLNQSIGEVPYVVQRSTDGGATWENFKETRELFVLDMPQFSGPTAPPADLSAQVIPADRETPGEVRLMWSTPAPDNGITHMYRVITRSALDALSDPSVAVGPEEVPHVAVRYRIKRTDGSNEIVLGETTEQEFADKTVMPYMNYTYSVCAIDAAENISEAAVITVDTSDLIPPEAPEIVDVEVI